MSKLMCFFLFFNFLIIHVSTSQVMAGPKCDIPDYRYAGSIKTDDWRINNYDLSTESGEKIRFKNSKSGVQYSTGSNIRTAYAIFAVKTPCDDSYQDLYKIKGFADLSSGDCEDCFHDFNVVGENMHDHVLICNDNLYVSKQCIADARQKRQRLKLNFGFSGRDYNSYNVSIPEANYSRKVKVSTRSGVYVTIDLTPGEYTLIVKGDTYGLVEYDCLFCSDEKAHVYGNLKTKVHVKSGVENKYKILGYAKYDRNTQKIDVNGGLKWKVNGVKQ